MTLSLTERAVSSPSLICGPEPSGHLNIATARLCYMARESVVLLFADIDLLFLAKFSGAFHAHHQARSIIGKDIEVRSARVWPKTSFFTAGRGGHGDAFGRETVARGRH